MKFKAVVLYAVGIFLLSFAGCNEFGSRPSIPTKQILQSFVPEPSLFWEHAKVEGVSVIRVGGVFASGNIDAPADDMKLFLQQFSHTGNYDPDSEIGAAMRDYIVSMNEVAIKNSKTKEGMGVPIFHATKKSHIYEFKGDKNSKLELFVLPGMEHAFFLLTANAIPVES